MRITLPWDDSDFFSKLSSAVLARPTDSSTGVSSASRITRSAWSAISRCLEHHDGTSLERRKNGLAVMLRHAPLAFAAIVVEGDLGSRLAPARKGLVEKADGRAVFVRGQDFEAPQGVPAPRPVADGPETA